MTDPSYPDALPAHSRLHWYVIERVLGQGGFGITYLAHDTNLDQRVAIKEYLPIEFATRMPDATIRSRTDDLRDRYRWGLERFIQEARTLARFDHPSIVRVQSVFEFNNTAYMVMRFEEGINLAELLDRRGTLSEEELLRILLPILDGLERVHETGFIHRDIKPDNIHIGNDERSVLLDFGSARQALGNSHTLTILVAPGYAPFEQYYSDSGNQGPWTDIYGLGATCYRSIAGRSPLDAVSRSKGILGSTQDGLVPATVIGAGRYSGRLLAAIDHALAFSEKDRPQTLAQWRMELTGESTEATPVPASAGPAPPRQPKLATRTATAVQAPATPPRSETPAAPATTLRPPAPAPEAKRAGSPAFSGRVMAMALGVAILAIGTGAYFYFLERSRDASVRIAALEKQVRDQEIVDSARQRAPPPPVVEASPRREAEPQAPPAPAPGRAESAAKVASAERNAAERATAAKSKAPEPGNASAGVPAALPRSVDSKRREELARPLPQGTGTAQSAAPSRLGTSAPSAAKSALPAVASTPEPLTATPPAATTVPPTNQAKAAPQPDAIPRTAEPAPASATATPVQAPVNPLADAERAWDAQRFAEALALTRPLADAGNVRAQFLMAEAYAEGRGVARDGATAVRWYEKAALQGDSRAQVRLASLYASGNGVLRNNNLAYVWFGTASRLGSGAAKFEQEKIGALLQPAERAQLDKLVESSVARMSKKP